MSFLFFCAVAFSPHTWAPWPPSLSASNILMTWNIICSGVLCRLFLGFSNFLAAEQKPEQNGIIFYVCLGHLMCLHFCGLPYSRHPYQLADFNDTCWWPYSFSFNALAFFCWWDWAVEMTGYVIINELHFHFI